MCSFPKAVHHNSIPVVGQRDQSLNRSNSLVQPILDKRDFSSYILRYDECRDMGNFILVVVIA